LGGGAKRVSEHREAARPIVAGHGGRIVKTTGDGLLLEAVNCGCVTLSPPACSNKKPVYGATL
jgi:hypothetical protein